MISAKHMTLATVLLALAPQALASSYVCADSAGDQMSIEIPIQQIGGNDPFSVSVTPASGSALPGGWCYTFFREDCGNGASCRAVLPLANDPLATGVVADLWVPTAVAQGLMSGDGTGAVPTNTQVTVTYRAAKVKGSRVFSCEVR